MTMPFVHMMCEESVEQKYSKPPTTEIHYNPFYQVFRTCKFLSYDHTVPAS